MRIAVFGAGSIGGPLAAHLLRHGEEITLYTGNEEINTAITARGLRVRGARGDFDQPARPRVAPVAGDGPFDVALLAMKTNRLEDSVRAALPFLTPDGVVVCLQNGVPEPRALRIAGEHRVLGGVVGWGSSMEEPGLFTVTSKGTITLGDPRGAATERVRRLADHLASADVPAKTTDNLAGVRWSKLAINCTVTSLGALCGVPIGEMVRDTRLREIAFTVMSEVADVAAADHVRLEKVAGTFHLSSLYVPMSGTTSWTQLLVRHALLRAVGVKFRRQRSGITRSLDRGRRPEIDALNTFVVQRAAALGLPVPMNAAVSERVEELAAGRRRPSMDVWRELLPLARGRSGERPAQSQRPVST
jgi:2-dehydropantoate 2-reductase